VENAIAGLAPYQRAVTQWPSRALSWSGRTWFVVALLGQLLFAAYVLGFFGVTALRGEVARWAKVLPRGWVEGDLAGNLALLLHLGFAFVMLLAGALQLWPRVRRALPAFHRWNGRMYLCCCVLVSIAGLYMVWARGAVGDLGQHVAISINALLILLCAFMAWRAARARQFDRHQLWVLRLFLSVSGVWLFRIGLMLWLVLNQGPVGFDPETFTGPFLTTLAFAVYVFAPITVLTLFQRARASHSPRVHLLGALGMSALIALTFLGTLAASALLWLPKLASL